jgi:hypothetical protein
MHKSDVIFGVPKENAPPRKAPDENAPVLFYLPEGEINRTGTAIRTTFGEAAKVHYELGQTLARMMRDRGSAPSPDQPYTPTPVAVAA